MNDRRILTAESVTEGHPDKVCDAIADGVLDACLAEDPGARVACEVMATAGKITVAGEITAKTMPDISAIVARTVREIGYPSSDYEIEVITHAQSLDIAAAVGGGRQTGAGDQGVVYGYACLETDALLPLPVVLAHRITRMLANARRLGTIRGLRPDGKAQVSVEYLFGLPSRIVSVVVSCQHDGDKDLEELRREVLARVITPALEELPPDRETEILINPGGRFVLGGFEADTGLTGRKVMADTYGGLVPHGGGALSGKDGKGGPNRSPAKRVRLGEEAQGSERSFRRQAETETSGLCADEDRSGAYIARYIAKNLVAAGSAERCTVSLAYAIGKADPVAVDVDSHGTGEYPDAVLEQAVRGVFDLTPTGMIRTLGLDKPIFARFCNYGHFTHPDAPWERTDRGQALEGACRFWGTGVSSR